MISFRPYGDGFFAQIPIFVGFSHAARQQAGECRGHAPSYVAPLIFHGEAFTSLEIVFGPVSDQTRRSTDLPSSKCFLICLYSKAGKKGVLIEVSLMLRKIISVSACGNKCLIFLCWMNNCKWRQLRAGVNCCVTQWHCTVSNCVIPEQSTYRQRRYS